MNFILIIIAVVVLLSAGLFFFQSKILFHPVVLDKDYKFKFDLPFEEKFIKYSENKMIDAVLFKPSNPSVRILYIHGNAGSLMEWGEVAEELSDKFKAEVLAIDYPGYGKSEGPVPSTEKELLECADAAFQELISDKNSKLPVVLYGRSLGSAVASYLASQHEVNGLVLETPYTSIKAMAGVVLPIVPSFFVRYELDNEKNIKDLKIPILILHGTADPVVPYSQALELSKINSHITFITIEGGTHNSLSESPLYWDAVSKFLKAREQSL